VWRFLAVVWRELTYFRACVADLGRSVPAHHPEPRPSDGREELLCELNELVTAAEVLKYRVDDIKEWLRAAGKHASIDDMKARIRELEMKPFEAGALDV
jgi:hypothetical protein